jgi:hypothetical protein
MVMVLLRGICHPDPQYLAVSVREAKCTRLGYETRQSWPYTLDPPLALAFSRDNHLATPDPEQENNQGIPDSRRYPTQSCLRQGYTTRA